ncbi:MAG: 16S rRNA (cytosine(967)-C(5))-methyltransferase RsmB [Lachnospiraceae bacterium]|nr:16S rRNA (cytosine(967)-C(5))-methyltransferase RsmB [Lachnospiraceae bacterium]
MTDGVNSRELVLGILLAVTKEEEYSHIALSAVLEKYQYLSKQERGFITRVTEGTLENMIELDYIINQFSKVKVNKMKPVIRCILRMSVYQLKYMDSVPASAACNEAVKLAKRKGFASLKAFVNGVLRNISRNLDTVIYPDESKEPFKAYAVRYSIPEWMIKQWAKDYGLERAKSIAAAFKQEGKTTIRTNLLKTTPEALRVALEQEGINVEPVELPVGMKMSETADMHYAMHISGYDYLGAIPQFNEGLFYVQDVSSMLVSQLAEPKPSDYVLDVCAAPGGKSLHMAEKLQGSGMVEARDVTGYKVDLMEENIARCGMENMKAVQWDARILDEEAIEKADIVIADLPCSGLGVLRKKTDIRYRMTEEKEKNLVELQREILSVVHKYVKPKGTLMYSTCTIDKMENEENTAWFLAQYPEFTLIFEHQIFPDEGNGDGFYIAKFKRSEK